MKWIIDKIVLEGIDGTTLAELDGMWEELEATDPDAPPLWPKVIVWNGKAYVGIGIPDCDDPRRSMLVYEETTVAFIDEDDVLAALGRRLAEMRE